MHKTPFPVSMRNMQESDVAMIINSWLMSHYDTPALAWMPRGTYLRMYHDTVQRALYEPSNQVVIACNPHDPEQIFGWAIHGQGVMHYIYVKKTYRRLHIGSMLLEKALGKVPMRLQCTHWGRICEAPPYDMTLEYVPSKWWTSTRVEQTKRFGHPHE